jgi:hypothetical protein
MSLLDIIKNLFCGNKCEKPATEQHNEAEIKPEVKPEPIIAPKTEAKPKPVSAPAPSKDQPAGSQIPEDSTLRRHFLANQEAEKQPKVVAKAVTPIIKKVEPVATAPKAIKTLVEKAASLQIPEDATLKRHFISALKTKIEAGMPVRPTDSALKRHYDATVKAELDKLLA